MCVTWCGVSRIQVQPVEFIYVCRGSEREQATTLRGAERKREKDAAGHVRTLDESIVKGKEGRRA